MTTRDRRQRGDHLEVTKLLPKLDGRRRSVSHGKVVDLSTCWYAYTHSVGNDSKLWCPPAL
jgi:hypothetical protein